MNPCSRFSVDHPWTVLLLTTLLVIFSAMGAQKLVFKADYRVFFGESNPQLEAFEKMQRVYAKTDNVAFVLAPKDGNVFSEKTLRAIQELTRAAWQIPFSSRVDSVTNFQHTSAEGDDLLVMDLVPEDEPLPAERLDRIRRIATSEPLLLKRIVNATGSVTVVNVTLQLPEKDPVHEVPQVVEKARAIRDAFVQAHPDIEVHLSGMAMMNHSFDEASQNDSKTLIPLMFAMVALAVAVLLRTFTGTLGTVAVIGYAIAATMGLAGWTGFYLTGPSATTPIMVLTLSVADCVHILSTLFHEMRHGKNKREALLSSLQINMQPIFLTSVTTAIGFLSLNFSDSPPFRDLGNMVAAGVMLAFVLSVTFFPALLMALPVKVKPLDERRRRNDPFLRLADWVIDHRRWLLPLMSVLIVGLSVLAPLNRLNDDFVKYFDHRVPFRQATDFMQEHLTGMTRMDISLDSGTSSGINDPAFLQTVEDLSNWLRQQPETDHVDTITDTLKRLNRNMHGDDPAWYRLPDNQELAAQYLLLYEMSLPYGLDLNNQLNVDKSSTRIVATFRNLTSQEIIDLENRIHAWKAEHAPELQMDVASPSIMFAHIGQRNIVSMLEGTLSALVLISVILGFALRSGKFGLVSLFPNLAPAGMAFGIWAVWVGEIGLGLSVVAGMTLGIVVDDTIHFMSKYLHARRELGKNTPDAVRHAFVSVGRALAVTTAVLAAGFMVLAQSSFKVNADMGLMTAITIVIALIVDFFFLPPLLMLVDRDQGATK